MIHCTQTDYMSYTDTNKPYKYRVLHAYLYGCIPEDAVVDELGNHIALLWLGTQCNFWFGNRHYNNAL